MDLKYALCIMLIAATALLIPGCISQEESSDAAPVPTENLPEGFELIAVINDSTPGVDMEDEIADFRKGEEDIGEVVATVGIYQWGEMGKDYDARITVMECEDADLAQAAVDNYISLPDFENPPFKGVERFSTAVVNGHQVTEIRDKVNDQIRYLYIWTDDDVVVLVKGNGDRGASLELASATGL